MGPWIRSFGACLSFLTYATTVLAAPSAPAVGSAAPDFNAYNRLTGETIPLSSQRGKVVILVFWNSWCGIELPLLEKAQTLIGQDKLTVFAVSFQEDPAAVPAIRKMASTWHINMTDDNDGAIASRYSISTVPHLLIIDRVGTVLASSVGYGDRTLQELIADIKHALAGTSPAEPAASTAAPATTKFIEAKRLTSYGSHQARLAAARPSRSASLRRRGAPKTMSALSMYL